MMKSALAAMAAALTICAASGAQAATVVDFNAFASGTSLGPSFNTGGFTFSTSGSGFRVPLAAVDADPGIIPNAIATGEGLGDIGATTFVSRAGGGVFDLISLDLANRLNLPVGGVVDFAFSNGSNLTVNLANAAGLQTFALNQLGIESFSFRPRIASGLAGFVQFDNLTVDNLASAAPEPSTWAMMILGFFGLGAMVRRGRKAARLAAA